ncbi:FkbM family methyltransferase [Aquisalimonas asiatica]|uniref:Methyltransferase, FkbM family n=1 Tax=Aquisalimonas asiatica TaxID=406100 RepID=A0A1H8TKB4_9GAMM|nr:FkbM family methyltransferase [Aquisalimonas asiatica]SEO90994.1 methyltransferase, FkbM family [Aquisalimonas asiatica]
MNPDVRARLRRSAGLARSLVVYWRPWRQPRLRRLYAGFVAPGDLVFDIGAHLGDRSTAFADLGARVIALEPQPHVRRWLMRIAARRPGITVCGEAVGAVPGEAWLSVSAANPTVSSLSPPWQQAVRSGNAGFRRVAWEDGVQVSVTTLDVLIARHGEPAFCKIDVEGFEAAVLEGLSRPLAALSFEFVAGALGEAERCLGRLSGLGAYLYNVIPGEGRVFRFPEWCGPEAMADWLRRGADGIASGDIYAVHDDHRRQS